MNYLQEVMVYKYYLMSSEIARLRRCFKTRPSSQHFAVLKVDLVVLFCSFLD